jgi:hypothetical protein
MRNPPIAAMRQMLACVHLLTCSPDLGAAIGRTAPR